MIFSGKERPVLSQSGFTLLEMIVAVTLVAMMAVGLWAIFRISLRSWSRGTESMDANQRHRSILNLVRKQMASTYGLFAPADPQQPGTDSLIFSGTENGLRFISLNSLQFQTSPGLTLVSYEVDQNSNGDYALVEKEVRYIGRPPDEEVFPSGSRATPIFETSRAAFLNTLIRGMPKTQPNGSGSGTDKSCANCPWQYPSP